MNAVVAQLPVKDAKLYRDSAGRLHKLLLDALKESWVAKPAVEKATEALLWCPGRTAAEVEDVFSSSPVLSRIRDEIWERISFWNDVRLVQEDDPWPFPEGEIFFEADSWTLHRYHG